MPIRLGVNIDHVATLRQVRDTIEPDPVAAAVICELAGADGITVHLREDRRHIQDRDLHLLRATVRTHLNLEMAVSEEILALALKVKPDQATLVPERRQELTTEGGLDVAGNEVTVAEAVKRLSGAGILVSLFVDPELEQVRAAKRVGADQVELHTGAYARAALRPDAKAPAPLCADQLAKLFQAGAQARELGLILAAGHGLTYWNVQPVCQIPDLAELNIGHSIVSRAVLVGLERAVREMKAELRPG